MRGGPVRGSMKLDNRPKKLLVKGVHEDGSQALRDWYEVRNLISFILIFGLGSQILTISQTTGQLESIESADFEAGAYIISFKSRAAAEQVSHSFINCSSLVTDYIFLK